VNIRGDPLWPMGLTTAVKTTDRIGAVVWFRTPTEA
jgi:hypothetical protein